MRQIIIITRVELLITPDEMIISREHVMLADAASPMHDSPIATSLWWWNLMISNTMHAYRRPAKVMTQMLANFIFAHNASFNT